MIQIYRQTRKSLPVAVLILADAAKKHAQYPVLNAANVSHPSCHDRSWFYSRPLSGFSASVTESINEIKVIEEVDDAIAIEVRAGQRA